MSPDYLLGKRQDTLELFQIFAWALSLKKVVVKVSTKEKHLYDEAATEQAVVLVLPMHNCLVRCRPNIQHISLD
jgi:hypothetical protein